MGSTSCGQRSRLLMFAQDIVGTINAPMSAASRTAVAPYCWNWAWLPALDRFSALKRPMQKPTVSFCWPWDPYESTSPWWEIFRYFEYCISCESTTRGLSITLGRSEDASKNLSASSQSCKHSRSFTCPEILWEILNKGFRISWKLCDCFRDSTVLGIFSNVWLWVNKWVFLEGENLGSKQ